MKTDDPLEEALAPLIDHEPSEADVAAVLVAAQRRRAVRLPSQALALTGAAAVAAAVVLLAVPQLGSYGTTDGVVLLERVAAVAKDQTTFAGYRYTEMAETRRWPSGEEQEQRTESWVDRHWNTRFVRHPGSRPDPAPGPVLVPAAQPYRFGDPNPDIADLPTEPHALREALVRVYRSERFPEAGEDYALVYEVLGALGTANATPDQRSGLWGVLALMPGVQEIDTREHGTTVTIPASDNGVSRTFTVTFDEMSSELLSWSVTAGDGPMYPAEARRVIRTGQVDRIGERP